MDNHGDLTDIVLLPDGSIQLMFQDNQEDVFITEYSRYYELFLQLIYLETRRGYNG